MRKSVQVKNVIIGGGAPVSIQTMTNTLTTDVAATVAQIERCVLAGADMVRVSVPDKASAYALKEIIQNTSAPVIADIHYDYRIALAAIEAGAHKIRINPSNTPREGLKEIARAARERNIPVRVGVNAGSVAGEATAETLANLALDNVKLLEDCGFTAIVLAVKSSNVKKTVDAYRIIYKACDYPLHIGLTESGTVSYGMVKSSVATGSLLLDGIGDTVRVSLSAPPEEEVFAAKKILRAVGLQKNFVEIIACPTCARTMIEVEKIAEELERRSARMNKPLKVAVMGCAVNGIGESKGANFGVCGGRDKSLIFYKGEILKTVDNASVIGELLALMEGYDG